MKLNTPLKLTFTTMRRRITFTLNPKSPSLLNPFLKRAIFRLNNILSISIQKNLQLKKVIQLKNRLKNLNTKKNPKSLSTISTKSKELIMEMIMVTKTMESKTATIMGMEMLVITMVIPMVTIITVI